MKNIKCELYNDNFQNYKRYNIPRANLVLADIPYNLGNNAYASSNEWYVNGDLKNGVDHYDSQKLMYWGKKLRPEQKELRGIWID